MGEAIRKTLAGTWTLQEYSIKDKTGSGDKFYPMGKDATGFLIYSTDGYVSAQMMAQGRPAYTSGRLHSGTTEEMAQAAKGYLAYAGRFEIDEETKTLTHYAEVSMNPTWLGKAQERQFALEGDTITITAPSNGAVLVWKRAADCSSR